MHPFTAIPQKWIQHWSFQAGTVIMFAFAVYWFVAILQGSGPAKKYKMKDFQCAGTLEACQKILGFWELHNEFDKAYTSMRWDWVFIGLWSVSFPMLSMIGVPLIGKPWASLLAWFLWLPVIIDICENCLTLYILHSFERSSLESCPPSFPWIMGMCFWPKVAIYFVGFVICMFVFLAAKLWPIIAWMKGRHPD